MLRRLLFILLFATTVFANTEDNYVPVEYDCDGATDEFTFSWPIGQTSDLEVILKLTSTEVEEVLDEDIDYTVSATSNDYSNGGTITTIDIYANTYTLTIRRETARSQDAILADTRVLRLAAIEDGLDKLTRLVQDLQEIIGRCLKIPKTETNDVDLVSISNRADKNITFGAEGDVTVTSVLSTGTANISEWGETFIDDGDAAEARGTLGLDTDDDVDFDEITTDDLITKSPWFDVRHPDFGAVGDGVIDDTAAIQAIFDAAAAVGGKVKFPNGVFICDSQLALSAPAGVILEGVSSSTQLVGSTIIRYTGIASPFIEISDTTAAASLKLKRLNIQYNNAGFSGTLVHLYAAPVSVEECDFTGNGVSTAAKLLDLHNCSYFNVEKCSFNNAIYAIDGEGSNAGKIDNCIFLTGIVTADILNPGDGWDICGGNAFENLADGTGKAIGFGGGKEAEGMNYVGNWHGDATDSSAWNWIDLQGDGWNISGNEFYGEGTLAAIAIKVTATSSGINICGNRLSSFDIGVDLGTANASDISILGNEFSTVTTHADVSGGLSGYAIIQGESGVCLDVYRAGATPVLRIPAAGNTILDSGLTVGAITASNGINIGGTLIQGGTGAITTTSGPGVIAINGQIHEVTTTGAGDAMTLANGTAGQRLTIIYVAEGAGGDTAVITPVTFAGGATITLNALGDSCDLQYSSTGGWYVLGLGGTAAVG